MKHMRLPSERDPRPRHTPTTAAFFVDNDGVPKNTRDLVRALCRNVVIDDASAPRIFHILADSAANLDETCSAILEKTAKVVHRLQLHGIQADDKKAGGGKIKGRAAAAKIASALGVEDFEDRASRAGPRRRRTRRAAKDA